VKSIKLSSLAAALALGMSLGGAIAQTGTPGGTGPSVNTTTPAAPTAPAVQPGVGTRNSPSNDKTTEVDRGDRKFIENAAGGGMFEVEIGKLASAKGSSQDVKSMGSMLVDDHTKANSELAQIANARKIELPAAPPRGMRKDAEKLAKLSGDKFDQEFAKVAVNDHKKDIKEFEKHSKDTKDAELKGWIDKTLPTLRAHLAAATKLQQAGKGKS
jgi:putative membrane protein